MQKTYISIDRQLLVRISYRWTTVYRQKIIGHSRYLTAGAYGVHGNKNHLFAARSDHPTRNCTELPPSPPNRVKSPAPHFTDLFMISDKEALSTRTTKWRLLRHDPRTHIECDSLLFLFTQGGQDFNPRTHIECDSENGSNAPI